MRRRLTACALAVLALLSGGGHFAVAQSSDAAVPYPPVCCAYQFRDPWLPALVLPPAQPDSPGDIKMNPTNPLVRAVDGSPATACNGDRMEYWDPAQRRWIADYKDTEGVTHEFDHIFYTTGSDALMISTLQTWQSGLATLLDGRLVRLRIACDNAPPQPGSCVQFTIGAQQDPDLAARDRSVDPQCLADSDTTLPPSDPDPQPLPPDEPVGSDPDAGNPDPSNPLDPTGAATPTAHASLGAAAVALLAAWAAWQRA